MRFLGFPLTEAAFTRNWARRSTPPHSPPFLRSALRHVEPALFNRYERHYFQSCDRRFRLTVDFRLQFAGVPYGHRQTMNSSPPAKTVILELKFGPELAVDADVVTNAWPFRVARFSKYVAGIERV